MTNSPAAVAPAPSAPIGLISVSTFCRSFSLHIGLLATQAYFIESAGSARLSDLVFLASLIVLTLFLIQAALGERVIAGIYMACLCAMGLGFVGIVATGHATTALYYSGTIIQVTDAVGATASTLTISALLSPTVFRGVFLKMMTMELSGRLSANALFWLLGWQDLTSLALAFGLVAVTLHLVTFTRFTFGLRSAIEHVPAAGRPRIREQIARAVRFIVENPLLKTALFVMIWTHVTKILVELSFFGAVERFSVGVKGIGVAISVMNIVILVVTLVAQKTFGNRLNKRWRLATLLLILPVGTLILSTVGYLGYSLISVGLLMLFFQVTNRAIEMPTSRQCLVPVPASLRGSIVSLVSLAMAAAGMVSGGLLSSFRAAASPSYLMISLILMSFVGLLGLSDLDSDYFQNLWRFVRERVSGTTDAWLDWLPSAARPAEGPASHADTDGADEAVPLIEKTLGANAYQERAEIERVARRHQALISEAPDVDTRRRAFDLLWRLSPRWARRFLPTDAALLARRDAIERTCESWKETFRLNYFEASAVRAVMLRWESDIPWVTSQLQDMLEHARDDRAYLVRSIYRYRGARDEFDVLHRLVVGHEPLAAWLATVASSRLTERGLLKVALDLLARRRPAGVHEALTENVRALRTVSIPLLYLEERLVLRDKTVPVSELDLLVDQAGNVQNYRLVADLHLEILKGSANEDAWRMLMTQA